MRKAHTHGAPRPQRACSPHGAPGPGRFASCREPSPPPQRQPPGAVDFARFALHITSAIGDASGRTPCRHHRRKPDRALVWLPSDPLILFDIRIWRTKVAKRSPGCRTRPATTVTAELHSIVLPPVIRGASRLSPASSLHPCRGASPTDTWWDIPASR